MLKLKLKVEEVQKIINTLEERLRTNIPELKQIVISIEAYDLAGSVVLPKLGKQIGSLAGFEQIGPKKLGERIIVPLEIDEEKISSLFGAPRYLIVDKKNGNILRKEIFNNPYFDKSSSHGSRFTKAVRADKVLTQQIGPNAKQNLENFGIKVEIISLEKNIKEIL